jgi:6-phosphogluconolactonase
VAEYYVYAGTYTRKDSVGIYPFKFNPADGSLEPVAEPAPSSNPSFLAVHPTGKFLYAANEDEVGGVTAYEIQAGGGLSKLNEQPSHGSAPCHLMCEATGKFLIVANYTSGTVSMCPTGSDGHLGEATEKIQHAGSSILPRQTGPHAHSANIDAQNRFAYLADLGMDQVVIYEMDVQRGKLRPAGHLKTAPGAGPRHFHFHPNGKNAYLINEIGCTVSALNYDSTSGALEEINTLSTLPGEVEKGFSTADIHVHPNGKFVYGSNRGHNTIACYRTDQATGAIEFVDRTDVEPVPRNFAIDPSGTYLLAAGSNSGKTTTFKIDGETGSLTSTGIVTEIPECVCLLFVGA